MAQSCGNDIRLGPGRSGQSFLTDSLYSPPLNPLPSDPPPRKVGPRLCEPTHLPPGPAVKSRILPWIWALCGWGFCVEAKFLRY